MQLKHNPAVPQLTEVLLFLAKHLLQNDLIYNFLSKRLKTFELPPFKNIFAKIFIKRRIKWPERSKCVSYHKPNAGLQFMINESCVPFQFRDTVPTSVPICNSTMDMNEKFMSIILHYDDLLK